MDKYQFLVLVGLFSFLIRGILQKLFKYDISEQLTHRKRMKELDFSKKDKDKKEIISELSQRVSEPIIKYLFPHIRIGDMKELEMKLKAAEWDKYITPIQYKAISIALKIIGVVMFLVFIGKSKLIAFVMLFVFGLLVDLGLKGEADARHDKLLTGFPDFIEVMNVYLSSGNTYTEALMETMKSMNDDWQEIIKKMIIKSSTGDIPASLDVLVDEYNTVDVKEFAALIKISQIQGGNLEQAFKDQAKKAEEIYIDAKEIQIEKRKTTAIVIQVFLMVSFMLAFALPMIGRLRGFFG